MVAEASSLAIDKMNLGSGQGLVGGSDPDFGGEEPLTFINDEKVGKSILMWEVTARFRREKCNKVALEAN